MIPYVYDDATPCPPDADLDALELLAKARGKAAVDEVEHAVAVLDADLKSRFKHQIRNLRSIRVACKGVIDLVERRRIYAGRAAALRKILAMPKGKLPPAPVFPDLTTLKDDVRPGDLQRHIASQIAIAKEQLAAIDRDIALWTGIAAVDARYEKERMSLESVPMPRSEKAGPRLLGHQGVPAGDEKENASTYASRMAANRRLWPQDSILERLVIHAARRRELLGRIAALEADATSSAALVARKVKLAVRQAGGESAVILAAVAADAVSNLTPPSNVQALEAMKAETEAALSRLSSAGVTEGRAADLAKAKLADVVAQLATAKQESIDRRRAVAAATVERAVEGDENARAQLERLATAYPVAFAPGFASAIASARWDHAAFAEILSTIPA